MSEKRFDIVIFGATGFTGTLICAYMASLCSSGLAVRWAMAGRSLEKLEAVRDRIGTGNTPLLVADASDPAAIAALVGATCIVISAAGPYHLYGTPLVAACAQQGTDYIDLCGEPIWMRRMIDEYEAQAIRSGARIIFSCGFDSIPSELGVWLCQQEAQRRFGKPMPHVRGRVRTFTASPSGGSVASGMATMKLATDHPELAALLDNPYALTPGFEGPAHPSTANIEVDEDVGRVGPFTLGPTDMKNVHRSNLLMDHPYGTDFIYDERLVDPPSVPPTLPSPDMLAKPGEGPSADQRAAGRFDLLFIGSDGQGNEVRVVVSGDDDPGYETSSRMVVETALCLLEHEEVKAGILTPGAAFQQALLDRLSQRAGVNFKIA